MEAVLRQTSRNFAGACQALNQQAAGESECTVSENKAIPRKGEAWNFSFCEACGKPLAHSDLIGWHNRTQFHIKGYKCPACMHATARTTTNGDGKNRFFDWQRIGIPRNGGSHHDQE